MRELELSYKGRYLNCLDLHALSYTTASMPALCCYTWEVGVCLRLCIGQGSGCGGVYAGRVAHRVGVGGGRVKGVGALSL
jgi:hypothetical protein